VASQVRFQEKTIEEFYNPLLFLVQKKNWIQRQQDERMKLSSERHTGQTDEWAEILRSFYDGYILPLRTDIAEYFKTKSFLMEEEPESFVQFLKHDAEERPLYTLWRDKHIDGILEAVDWPVNLESDIRKTQQRLEAELRALLKLPPIARGTGAETRFEPGGLTEGGDQSRITGPRSSHDQFLLEPEVANS